MSLSDIWRQVIDAPGDASVRARYVEAQAQAGDPRAELFRLAAEIESLPYGNRKRREELNRQYESLLAEWRSDFDAAARRWKAEIGYIGGWPAQITVRASDFLRHAPEIVATVPLRHLNLTAVRDAPEALSIVPFGQIFSLDGSDQPWSRTAVAALAGSPHLGSLRWLNLTRTAITDADVEVLAASPHLRRLAYVDVTRNPCRNPVDAAAGWGVDGFTGLIVAESIGLPEFGRELEARYGVIDWLHALDRYREDYPPDRYRF